MDQSETSFIHELMTPSEVSAFLKVPESTLAVWRSTGRVRLDFLKVGRAVRYLRADVERFLFARRGGGHA